MFSVAELFLETNDLQKLMMFEERCVDSYLREKDTLLHATQEEQMRVMGDRYILSLGLINKSKFLIVSFFTANSRTDGWRDGPIDWLTDWLTARLTSCHRLTGSYLADCRTGGLVDWLIDSLMTGWLSDRLVWWLTNWMIEWLVNSLNDWLTDYQTD